MIFFLLINLKYFAIRYLVLIKANFRLSKENIDPKDGNIQKNEIENSTNLTRQEFEEFIIKSGASGSFMVFRSDKKDEELGLDEL